MADEIVRWLEAQGLEKYADVFVENEIDFAAARHLDDKDLKELGLPMGPRKKLMVAISELMVPTREFAAPPDLASNRTSTQQAERRQLTVMFCDLVGSTALSLELDPEDLRDIMRRYQDAVAGVVTRYRGHVAKYLGDGVLSYFGWPQAYEDQAERAVRAALDAIAAVRGVEIGSLGALDARVGIATGQVVVGDLVGESGLDSEAVTGETPNLAARLQGVAEPGQIVIGDRTRLLIGRAFALSDLGARELKGFKEPQRTWQVIGEAEIESRFEAAHGTALSKLIGRERELQLLSQRWEQAKSGAGQVVLISAEAGMGKSRLVQALRDNVVQERCFFTHLQASPYHTNTPLFATIQNLRQAIGFDDEDSRTSRLDKLEAFLRRNMEVTDETLGLFADLFGLEYEDRYGAVDLAPEERKDRTLDTLINRFLMLSRQRPFLFIIEDAHWGDPTAEEMIERLVPEIAEEKVMLVVTHRPEWHASFSGETHVSSVQLTGLRKSQSKEIVRENAGQKIPDDIVRRIVERTDGIPLFIEELTKSIVEGGLDKADANIPATLQASLLARLDRLDPKAKEVAQICSTIGREFTQDVLMAVTGMPEDAMTSVLDQLVRSGLVQKLNSTSMMAYHFKHALVQDAAYQSLLRATRQDFHNRIAVLLESQLESGRQIQFELLAHHFSEAERSDKAVSYWLKAGQLAASRSANLEAIAHLSRGRAVLTVEPESAERNALELDICLTLGPALMSTKGLAAPEAEEVYLRAHQLCQSVKKADLSFQSAWGLWLVNQQRGRVDAARSQTFEVLSLAEEQPENTDYLLQAHHAAWTTELFIGNISSCHSHIVEGISLYDIVKHRIHAFTYGGHDPGVCAKTTAAEVFCLLGYPDQAVLNAEDGLSLAKKLSHPFSLAMAQYFMAQVHQYRLERDNVRLFANATIEMCEAHGFESFRAQAMVLLGWSIARDGEAEVGIEIIREGMAILKSTGAGMRRPYFLALLAQALANADRTDEGLRAIEEAEATIEHSGEARWQAETQRLKGTLMEGAGFTFEDVEATYESAMKVATTQEARWLQLRISVNLGQLWYRHSRAKEAYDLLAPIYASFDEGFETPDLIAAKELLTQLQ